MSPNMGFVKRRLERKITLHPQPNRLSSRMSPSYHIHRMEVQSGSSKSFFSILVFNLKLFFSCYVFSVKFMNWTKMQLASECKDKCITSSICPKRKLQIFPTFPQNWKPVYKQLCKSLKNISVSEAQEILRCLSAYKNFRNQVL